MSRLASPTERQSHPRLERLLLTSALALVLISLPATMSTKGSVLDWQAALAKSDNANGGNAGGNGNGHGRGGRGGGHGVDDENLLHRGQGHGQAGTAGGPHDVNEFLDGVRSGKAFGLERRDERITAARARYQEALGRRGRGAGPGDDTDAVAHGFSFEETTALIERGWKGPKANDGFRNHGERTRTMVDLARQLGYGARVGALQANFGTPFENGIAELQAELAAAEEAGDEAEVERLQGELATAIAEAKPGVGPDDGWATADLDVNDDQMVDASDLEALASGGATDAPEPEQDQLAEQSL